MIEEEKQLGNDSPEADSDAAESVADALPVEDAIDPLVAEAAAATEAANAASDAANTEALESLKATAETAQAQLEDFKQQYTRLAADFENFRKRTQKEKQDLEEQSKCGAIKELLPVVDNFERARAQIKPQNDGEMAIHKSYQGVYKQLVDALKRLGVAPMRPEGEMFDPMLHDAVMREETDEHPDGTVVEELMRGYVMGERVLRHAMVKVATAAEGTAAPEAADSE
ncbi:MAG: nucleotide exchange factor GrpE [Geitlerinemataceae cyanobacterium]